MLPAAASQAAAILDAVASCVGNKGDRAAPVLEGSRERAPAEELCFEENDPLLDPSPDTRAGHQHPPKSPRKAFFAIWSNKKYKFYKRITFRSMFSLKSWRGVSDHYKTAAEIPYIMLENPSKNDVVFSVPAAVRGGVSCIARSLAAGKGGSTRLCCAGATISNK